MVLSPRRLPFLLRVLVSPVPRSPRYYEGATTSHPRINSRLLVRSRRPRAPPVFVFASSAPGRVEVSSRPGPLLLPASPSPACSARTRMGSLRSSGDPSCAFAPFQDPGRTGASSPLTAASILPPLSGRRRLRRWLISGLTRSFGTCCLTLHAVVAAHVQSSLPAGRLGLYRAGVEPAGSLRGVSAHRHPPLLLS